MKYPAILKVSPVVEPAHQGIQADTITSLLDWLKLPQPSHLARKRAITSNTPPIGKKKGKGATAGDPKSVSPAERAKAYQLTVSDKKIVLFWLLRTTISKEEFDLRNVKGKERLASKQKRQLDIAESLKRYDDKVHPSEETLPVSTRVYRVNVVTALLKAGVPLNKLDSF